MVWVIELRLIIIFYFVNSFLCACAWWVVVFWVQWFYRYWDWSIYFFWNLFFDYKLVHILICWSFFWGRHIFDRIINLLIIVHLLRWENWILMVLVRDRNVLLENWGIVISSRNLLFIWFVLFILCWNGRVRDSGGGWFWCLRLGSSGDLIVYRSRIFGLIFLLDRLGLLIGFIVILWVLEDHFWF